VEDILEDKLETRLEHKANKNGDILRMRNEDETNKVDEDETYVNYGHRT